MKREMTITAAMRYRKAIKSLINDFQRVYNSRQKYIRTGNSPHTAARYDVNQLVDKMQGLTDLHEALSDGIAKANISGGVNEIRNRIDHINDMLLILARCEMDCLNFTEYEYVENSAGIEEKVEYQLLLDKDNISSKIASLKNEKFDLETQLSSINGSVIIEFNEWDVLEEAMKDRPN